jgi:hypothetical protein
MGSVIFMYVNLLGVHYAKWNEYFFHRNTAVLEGVFIEVHKLVVVIRVHKKVAVLCEDV